MPRGKQPHRKVLVITTTQLGMMYCANDTTLRSQPVEAMPWGGPKGKQGQNLTRHQPADDAAGQRPTE